MADDSRKTLRWAEDGWIHGRLHALEMPACALIVACTPEGSVHAQMPFSALTPGEARTLGLTLIEAAGRAEGYRVVRMREVER